MEDADIMTYDDLLTSYVGNITASPKCNCKFCGEDGLMVMTMEWRKQ